ncbi:HTH domain-containing protein [Clostridium collagenovorans DSM 3089]|uniref:HTH domain-containing protein n=1 Tax=Clostridium collagenovorans DSM 3089 TaxID=1121306 RepID=A0A1M5SHL0_9CLOT|nr:HTH domain-containing protein [Clostridium collagenovorans]SHH37383.1 HTH domain-containing protein [Clostridium collagenovorans DSM 3089]
MRILEILFYLLKCNSKTTIGELARIFKVSEKTIGRDLDKLSVLGIPIISYRGVNGGIEIDKNYVIAKYVLTESDYKNLILSLYIAENIVGSLKKSDLIDKFKLINNDGCNEILSKLEKRFIIDFDEKKRIPENDICKVIDEALDNKSFIKLEFKEENIEVFPICYVLKREGLYLYCYNEEYRLVLIDNIHRVSLNYTYYEKEVIPYEDNKENLIIM